MPTIKLPAFNGMNNRAKDTAMPVDPDTGAVKLRNAVNVVFTDENKLVFPRPGSTEVYTGNVSWVYEGRFVTVFVEDGNLKRLDYDPINENYSAVLLKSDFGTDALVATAVGDYIYVSSSLALARIDANGNYTQWGTPRPSRNPTATAVSAGELYPGDYRIVITWIGYGGDESGCGNGTRLTVADGGGIHLTNFPTPPDAVDKVAVYVTSVNSKDFYLYGEYPRDVSDVTIARAIDNTPLMTQFTYVPVPTDGISCAHYGRIYYGRGSRVFWTMTRRYGNQKKMSFWRFDSDVQAIVSLPGVLYVGTQHFIYSLRNIDVPDTAAEKTALIKAGAVKGSVTYHSDGKRAFFMSDRGVIEATSEGLTERTFKDVAIPFFERGSSVVTTAEGSEILVFVGQDARANPLADSDYQAAEIARGSL